MCEGILNISALDQSGKVEPGQPTINLYVYGESDLQYMYKINLSSDKFRGFYVISEGMHTFVLSVKCHSIQELSRCNNGSEQSGVVRIILADCGKERRGSQNNVRAYGKFNTCKCTKDRVKTKMRIQARTGPRPDTRTSLDHWTRSVYAPPQLQLPGWRAS